MSSKYGEKVIESLIAAETSEKGRNHMISALNKKNDPYFDRVHSGLRSINFQGALNLRGINTSRKRY